MKVKELQTVEISPNVSALFAVAWSEDNKISVVTEKGVYILEFIPQPSSVSPGFGFLKTWIKSAESLPTVGTGVDINTLLWTLEKQDAYQAVLDVAVTPQLPTTKPVAPHTVRAAWSPRGMVMYGRCLIATLSNCGAVLLHAFRDGAWRIAADVSELWAAHCAEQWPEEDPTTSHEKFLLHTKRTNQIKATEVCWSGLLKPGWCLLLTAHKDGAVTVWGVEAVGPALEPARSTVRLLLMVQMGLNIITSLLWCKRPGNKGLVVAGEHAGRIRAVAVHCSEDTSVTLDTPDIEMWPDQDRITISKIVELPGACGDKFVTLVACKGSFVIPFNLDDSYNVVAVFPQHLGNLNLSGIQVTDTNSLFLSTFTGVLKKMTITADESGKMDIQMQQYDSDINFSHFSCHGVAASANKVIWLAICSVCRMYDHLVRRDPSQLVVFSVSGLEDPMNLLNNNPTTSLSCYWDCLEMIRYQGVLGAEIPGLENILQTSGVEGHGAYEMRVLLWLVRMALAQECPMDELEKSRHLGTLATQLQTALCLNHVTSYVPRVLALERVDAQVTLLHRWLGRYLATVPFSHEGPQQLARDTRHMIEARVSSTLLQASELCDICSREVVMDSPIMATCPAGHSFPRCCLSLLPCSSVPYLQCVVCHAVAHPRSVLSSEDPLCPYCEVPLDYEYGLLAGQEVADNSDSE